jgi:hypothetical protein
MESFGEFESGDGMRGDSQMSVCAFLLALCAVKKLE